MPLDHAANLELQRGQRALGDVAHGDVEILRCRLALVGLSDLVDLDTQTGCQLSDRRTPGDAEHARLQQHRNLVQRLRESHVVHDLRAVVAGVIVDLHATHLLDPLAGAREGERDQVVGEPGVDTTDKKARIALPSSIFHAGDVLIRHYTPRILQQPG